MIDITFPSELTPTITSSCITSNNFSSPASTQCQLISQTVRISNLSTADITANTYSFTLQTITNSDRALTTSNFSMIVYYTNDTLAQAGINSILGVTMQPQELNASQINFVLSNNIVSASPVTAAVSFIALDAVPANGYITVTIPPEISFINNYLPQCELLIGTSASVPSCSLNGSILTVPLGTQTITTGQTVTVTLKSFGTNPPSTLTTSFF